MLNHILVPDGLSTLSESCLYRNLLMKDASKIARIIKLEEVFVQ